MVKRISCLMLTFLMMLTLIPTGALAAGEQHFDKLIIGSKNFTAAELASSGTYSGDKWKLVLPRLPGQPVSLTLYDGFKGEVYAEYRKTTDSRSLEITSEGEVTLPKGIKFIHPGDVCLTLNSKPGSVTRIGPDVYEGIFVGPVTTTDWANYMSTPRPQMDHPTVILKGEGYYQINAKEYGISAYSGYARESSGTFLNMKLYGKVQLEGLVNVNVDVSGTQKWCTGIRTGYYYTAATGKKDTFESYLKIGEYANLSIRTNVSATNMGSGGCADWDKNYHKESGTVDGKTYSVTIPGFIPVITVDGKMGNVLSGSTLTCSTKGIASMEVDWYMDAQKVVLPFTVRNGSYHADIRVKPASGYKLLPGTKMMVLGQLINYASYSDNQLEFRTRTVEIRKPVITQQPSAVSATEGNSAFVSVQAQNADTYQWLFCDEDGQVYPDVYVSQNAQLSGQTTNRMQFVPMHGWNSGWPGNGVYVCCKISNADGTVYSDMVRITVKENTPEPVDPKPTEPDPVVPYVFPFTDVKPSDWFYNDVVYANKNGLINGKTPTLYMPADNMTIAEAIKLASCMHQLNKTGSVTLTNGSPNWYDSYVQYAKNNGIAWNYSNYNAPVTREEYVHIFYGALPASSYKAINSVASVPDVSSGSAYYKEILTFYNAGILTGNDPKGTFLPKSSIKRSEVAAILTRMMDDSARKTYTLVP